MNVGTSTYKKRGGYVRTSSPQYVHEVSNAAAKGGESVEGIAGRTKILLLLLRVRSAPDRLAAAGPSRVAKGAPAPSAGVLPGAAAVAILPPSLFTFAAAPAHYF